MKSRSRAMAVQARGLLPAARRMAMARRPLSSSFSSSSDPCSEATQFLHSLLHPVPAPPLPQSPSLHSILRSDGEGMTFSKLLPSKTSYSSSKPSESRRDKLIVMITEFARSITTKKYKDSKELAADISTFRKTVSALKLKPANAYNVLIEHCCNRGEILLGLDLQEEMQGNGIARSASTFEPFIKHFAKTLNLSQAEEMLSAMKRLRLQGTQQIYKYLIKAYSRSEDLDKAYNLLEEVRLVGLKCTPSMYNAIILAYGKQGRLQKACLVLKQMENVGVQPDSENYATLLQACALRKNQDMAMKVLRIMRKQGIQASENVFTSLVNTFVMCGNIERAEQIFNEGKQVNAVNKATESAMLSGYAKQGSLKEALAIFNDIRSRGEWPKVHAFSSFLGAVGMSGDIDCLLQLFEQLMESMQTAGQVDWETAISFACVTVIRSFIRHSKLEQAIEFLKNVQQNRLGDVNILCTKVFLPDSDDPLEPEDTFQLCLDDKFKFLAAMWEKLNIHPSRIAFEALLTTCAKEKDISRAELVRDMMLKQNLQFSSLTYIIMFQAYVACGDEERTVMLLSEMAKTLGKEFFTHKDIRDLILHTLRHLENSENVSLKIKDGDSIFKQLKQYLELP